MTSAIRFLFAAAVSAAALAQADTGARPAELDRARAGDRHVVPPHTGTGTTRQSPESIGQVKQFLDGLGLEGGLVVHVGCGAPPAGEEWLTAVLRRNRCVVQGLDRSAENVAAARTHLLREGVYGNISVRRYDGRGLPYNDNLVNVMVVEENEPVAREEILRALVPGGKALVRKNETWTEWVKPVPDDLDGWGHAVYDATGNAVSNDGAVGPPRHLQWFAPPRFGRHHEHMSSVSTVVTAGGRLFTIIDEGSPVSILLPSRWKLIARDAYNGALLWKRPIEQWHCRYFPMKHGPSVLGHRVVATEDVVYVTLGREAPITALDARTGKTLREYAPTANTHEFVLDGGVLYAVCSDPDQPVLDYRRKLEHPVRERNRLFRTGYTRGPVTIRAVRADTGELLWSRDTPVQELSLAVKDDSVVFHNDERIVCLDRATGKQRWAGAPIHSGRTYPFGESATLVISQDVVLFSAGKGDVTAWSLHDGRKLWEAPQPGTGHHSARDIFVIDNVVWYGQTASGRQEGTFWARDLHTGEVIEKFNPDKDAYWFHHRCHRARATANYIVTSRTGTEFVDFRNRTWDINHWVRGACAYGIVPANGMLYAPSHPCACYQAAMLQYFNALAPASRLTYREAERSPAQRLEQGPAYDRPLEGAASPDDWPQYRRDMARSGYSPAAVSPAVEAAWTTRLGGRLSRLTAADGTVYVAAVDRHTLYALDADTGKLRWHYTTGGRIDSPPAYLDGRVFFGSADGWVYCLTAAKGELIWRYQAAPMQRQMMALGQLESAWPVHGSVLLRDGKLYATAGRSRFLDGGIRLLVLDPHSGTLLSDTLLDETGPDGKDLHTKVRGLSMPVGRSDILSANDEYVFMISQVFDPAGKPISVDVHPTGLDETEIRHLFTPTGFLDDSWFHRTYWLYGSKFNSGWNHWYDKGRVRPAGRLLVHNGESVFGFGRKQQYFRWSTPLEYHLYRMDESASEAAKEKERQTRAGWDAATDWLTYRWSVDVPLLIKAMVMTDQTIFIAGPPNALDEVQAWAHIDQEAWQAKIARQEQAIAGGLGSTLWSVSAENGERLAERILHSMPIYDGMAAAGGKLFLAMEDGSVRCFSAK